jgi:hypothetical protein
MDRSRIDRTHYPIQLRQAIALYLPTRGLALLGKGRWSDRLLVIVMLLLVWSGLPTLQERFAEARSAGVKMYFSRRRPGRSLAGFMNKMANHSRRLLEVVGQTLRLGMSESLGMHWRVGRFLAFAVDGTKIDCPRTRANQQQFKNGGRRKSGPQMLLVALIHLGSGLAWSWRSSHAKGSERGLLRDMLGDLPAGALLVADAGFVGYDAMSNIVAGGYRILMRAGANTRLLKKLGWRVKETRGMVYLWPQTACNRHCEPLVLRRIVLQDGRNRRMCLLTNLLEERELTAREAAELYGRRWQSELFFRAMKQTLGRRKMRCDSPRHAQVELDWSVMGQWLLGMMLWDQRPKKAVAHEGFAGALRSVREAMSGRGDRRSSLLRQMRSLGKDVYIRRSTKKARDWPHKKNDPPCGVPEVRMATAAEVRLAKALIALKRVV